MQNIFAFCPTAPTWRVPWRELDERLPFIRALVGCPQNPRYHAEGDVWVHTRMVCEAMAQDEDWQTLGEELRQDLFAAALFHDAAKPECTKIQKGGRITSRGHARRGALMARRLLWRAGVPAQRRERICRLVRHHMAPLYLRDSQQPHRQALMLSHSLRCDQLSVLGRADAEGRRCDDPEDLRARHRAFERTCRELGCFDRPFGFPSDHARFRFFRRLTDDPELPSGNPESEVILLSGLPGSGKERWLSENAPDVPIVDMDEVRRRRGVGLRENQGSVMAIGRDQARGWLGRGQSLVWRDMNLSRQLRDHLIGLFSSFETRVRIVHFETDEPAARRRMDGDRLYDVDLDYLLDRWEVPDRTEAHAVELRDA